MSQAIVPSSVHGMCQVVLVITSGQMIRRPAAHTGEFATTVTEPELGNDQIADP